MDEQQENHRPKHWRYVYRRRRRRHYNNTREILYGQLIAVSGAIGAGYILELNKTYLIAVTGVFLILPGIIDLSGSIAGAMGAHINHHLNTSRERPYLIVIKSLRHAFLLLLVAAVVLGLFGAAVGSLIFDADFYRLLVIGSLASVVAGIIGFPIVAATTYLAYKRGVDADNFIGPIETSVFDALTVLALSIVVRLVT